MGICLPAANDMNFFVICIYNCLTCLVKLELELESVYFNVKLKFYVIEILFTIAIVA